MKCKCFALVVLSLFIAGSCFALSDRVSDLWMTYEINNTSGVYKTTVIPTGSIRPGVDKILGWTIQGKSLNSENVIAVYDADASATVKDECLGESEANSEAVDGMWLVTPRKVEKGLVVTQGPNTKAFIYFTSL